jgi:DNA-binding MarR family transcriptional regulator
MEQPGHLTENELRAWRGYQKMSVGLASRLHRHLVAASRLSLPDYEVLTVLTGCPEDRLRAYELGAELQWEKSRLSHHLKRMESRGLVERVVCENDGRGLWVALTPAGRRAWQAAARVHDDEVRRLLLGRLSVEQVELLAEISDKVLAGMSDSDDLCEA